MRAGRRREGGFALLLALGAVAIISALLGGIMLLSASHLGLSHVNSCYASAMNVAEAGVNWELWKISHNPAAADQTPVTVEYPSGSGRTFTVHVEAFPGGGAWTPPSECWVISRGVVDDIGRTVRVRAGGQSVAGEYALFGISHLVLGGDAHVEGAMGTNGSVSINGDLDQDGSLEGDFWYCGAAAGGEQVTYPVDSPYQTHEAVLPEHFDTVNHLANDRVFERWGITNTQGVNYFATANDNGLPVDIAGNTVTLPTVVVKSTFTNIGVAQDPNPYLPDGVTPNPWYNRRVITLSPGDYYFEGFDLGSTDGIKLDTAAGVINLWFGPDGGGTSAEKDIINGSCLVFTGSDPEHFHVYEGSRRTLQMNGEMDFHGMVYAYNGPDASGGYYGNVVLNGTGSISGGVLAWNIQKMLGDFTVIYPSGGGGGDPSLFYQYRSWEEVGGL